jgi:signal peptidase I
MCAYKGSEAMQDARQRRGMAVFLTYVVPGLGQVYNGQAKKGVLFFSLFLISIPLAFIVVLELPLAPLNLLIGMLLFFGMYLYSIVDAKRLARRLGDTPSGQRSPWWYLAVMGVCMFIVMPVWVSAIRHAVGQAFKIPAGSMEKTLLIGDHILVSKYVYGLYNPWTGTRLFALHAPHRGDVIVFRYPWDTQRVFIKRVIALPGERVHLLNRQVYVNAQALQEPYVHSTASLSRDESFGPVAVPKNGDTLEIRSDNRLYLNGEPLPMPSGLYYPQDQGRAMTGFEVFYAPLFPAEVTLQQPVGPFPVAQNYYFTLGDTRNNSKDSRYWGFVPEANILGVAKTIYWSWDRVAEQVRWERIGQAIR